jgi:pimeloyl-ACP methyl ester carboxylesterase
MSRSSTTPVAAKVPLGLRLLRFMYHRAGPIFPQYFGKLAYEQWFTTARFKTPDYELPALNSALKETIEVNGLNVAVYIWQDKTIESRSTVLFIHGWTGRGTQIAKYIKPLNEIGYRVISFDGPAHGNTPGTQTSLLEFTDVVFALDKHYGPLDAAITHSFGGMVLAYAMSLGLLKVNRAVCICPPNNFQVLTENFQRILALPDNVMKVMVRKTYASHGQIIRDAVDTVNNVKNLKCKGLIIHDEDDIEIPWHSGEEIAQAWPDSRFIKTSGLGHRRIIHDKAVIKHIVDFLEAEH